MFIKIICIVALLEFSLSDNDPPTLPMKKDSNYGDDVCSYTKNEHKYVKHCEKGQFCDNLSIDELDSPLIGRFFEETNIQICQDLPNITSLYTFSEKSCQNDFECESTYKCIGNICSQKCSANEFLSHYGCFPNSYKGTAGVCFEMKIFKNEENPSYSYSPAEPNKICGKLTFEDDPNDNKKGIYYINKREYVYNGEVEDGEYVENKELCKSGFALYFFKDGKTEDPKDRTAVGNNQMHLRCVTPRSISKSKDGECFINYKINENGEILRYNVQKLYSLTSSHFEFNVIHDFYFNDEEFYFYAKYIKLKSEKYREYYTSMSEEERKTCENLDTSNKYSCENNELIKTWYFYKYPQKYSAYNDRKKIRKVVDFLIQKEYPCYSLSQFLSIKFIYLLFLLLF